MCTLHGLNWKHPETHNSSGNQDVRQLPLGQGLGGQCIELHPHYPLVWMKRFMSWNDLCLGKKRELRGKSEINLPRTLVIPRDGLTLVRVANFSNRPMRLQADVPVADIILSVVGRPFFSFEPKPDSTSFPQSSCSVKNKPIAKGQKPKEDEKVKSDSQVT